MKILIFLLMVLSSTVFSAENIVLIYVDQNTEKSLGEFPIARSHYAKLVEVTSKHKPKYIILKFFYDLKKAGDEILINEVKKHDNVFTQAYSFKGQEKSNLDISKYSISAKGLEHAPFESLMFPYKEMSEAFSGIGFVNGIVSEDGRVKDFEIVSSYKGKAYPSLPLLILEKEMKAKSSIQNNVLSIGSKKIKISNDLGMKLKLKKPGSFKTYSMIDVINGKVRKAELQDKILIVFYNGPKLTPAPAINGYSYNPADVVANAIDHILNL
jgi:CHASE2 domain-containing sensor protein